MIRLLVTASSIFLISSALLRAENPEVAAHLEVTSAVEPGLVSRPVRASLDNRGRLFVVEGARPDPERSELPATLPGSIRLLVDTDRDGVYDRATTFADDLTNPQGVLWLYDSLYVMASPGLWRFADPDGDGVAEERERLVTGFDFAGGEGAQGPFLHPNGRLFWTHGNLAYAIPDPDTGEILERGKGARLWSSRPGGGEVEAFAGIGTNHPVEIDFTEEGEILGTAFPRVETTFPRSSLIHWAYGGVHLAEEPRGEDTGLVRTTVALPALSALPGTAQGLIRYRSGHLDPAWKDGWIAACQTPPGLVLVRLARKGSSFARLDVEEILAPTGEQAGFSDVLEDHSGDLMVIDTGTAKDPSDPESEAKPGNIYRISRSGEAYRAPLYPDWESLTSEAVSGFLDVEEFWLRDRAGLELAGRGDPAIPELRRILQTASSTATAKRNAVWVLAKLSFSESTDLILDALKDPDASVRQAACHAMGVTRTWQSVAANEPDERVIELERNRTISGALATIVRSDEPPVARQAAVALGRMAEFRAVGAILGRLGRAGSDPYLEHSLIYALIEIDDPESTRPGLESENITVRNGALRALHEMPSGNLEVLSVLPYLDSPVDNIRRTAVEIAAESPHWDAALANRFYEWKEPNEHQVEVMTEIVSAFPDHPPILHFLSHLLQSDSRDVQILGLRLLNEADTVTPLPEWEPALADFLIDNSDAERRLLTLQALAKTRQSHLSAIVESLATDTSLTKLTRLHAERALSAGSDFLSEAAFDLWLELLTGDREIHARENALELLEVLTFSPEQRLALLNHLDRLSDGKTTTRILTTLAPLQNEAEVSALFHSIGKDSDHPPDSELHAREAVERMLKSFPDLVPPELIPPAPRQKTP